MHKPQEHNNHHTAAVIGSKKNRTIIVGTEQSILHNFAGSPLVENLTESKGDIKTAEWHLQKCIDLYKDHGSKERLINSAAHMLSIMSDVAGGEHIVKKYITKIAMLGIDPQELWKKVYEEKHLSIKEKQEEMVNRWNKLEDDNLRKYAIDAKENAMSTLAKELAKKPTNMQVFTMYLNFIKHTEEAVKRRNSDIEYTRIRAEITKLVADESMLYVSQNNPSEEELNMLNEVLASWE